MITDTFTFDDILIEPHASSRVTSRSTVETDTWLPGLGTLELPVISASMSVFDTIQNSRSIYYQFADAISDAGGMHIFSRSTLMSERLIAVDLISGNGSKVGIAVSLQEFHAYRDELESLPGHVLVSIDIANGAIIEPIDWQGDNGLVIGNFGNKNALSREDRGNIIYKAGIGSGAGCTTRVTTGVGVPQAWLVKQFNDESPLSYIISDGGVNGIDDFVKSVALGADAVMMGKLLAASQESPWQPKVINGKWYKPYRGMASAEEKGHTSHVEGQSGYIPYEGKSIANLMSELKDGLTSAMSYSDSKDIVEFQTKTRFLRVSNATRFESDHRLLLT